MNQIAKVIAITQVGGNYRVAGLERSKHGFLITCLEKVDEAGLLRKIEQEKFPLVVSILGRDQGESKLLIRHHLFPRMRSSCLRKALPFQLEKLSPISLNQAVIKAYHRVQDRGIDTTFFLVKKAHLIRHLEQMKPLEPVAVSIEAVALARFGHFFADPPALYLIVYLQSDSTYLVLVNRRVPIAHIILAMGTQHLGDQQQAQRYQQEIARSIFCLLEKERKLSTFLVCGEDQHATQIGGWLTEEASTRLTQIVPSSYEGCEVDQLGQYAMELGGALDWLEGDELSVNLCRGELSSRTEKICNLNTVKRFAMLVGGIMIGVSLISLLLVGQARSKVGTKVDRCVSQIAAGLDVESLQRLKAGRLEQRIELLREQDRTLQDRLVYLEQAPKLIRLLTLLANHPPFCTETMQDGVELIELEYELTSDVGLNHLITNCQPYVRILFWCREEVEAEQIYQELLANSSFVDSAHEITWSEDADRYEVTFVYKY